MKFLMYSQSGEGAQVLKRIELEGNECEIYIKDKAFKTCFNGLLKKTESPNPDKNTIVIFDISGNGHVADGYRRSGIKVYGSSAFADQLENDRKFGFEMMKISGIQIPEYEEFTDFDDGIEYVISKFKNKDSKLVFKPSGSLPTKLTYVPGDNPEELIAYMSFVEKQYKKYIKSFILQEFIQGVVVSSEFFCDGEKFIYPPNHTVEVKKSMNDDLGPSTGCSGNITWVVNEYNDRIIQQGVMLAEEICATNQYIGQLDLNCVVNSSGVYGLEWTPRFGYDATPTLLTLLNMDCGELFAGLANQQIQEIDISTDYAAGVRVTIPPYPAEIFNEDNPKNIDTSLSKSSFGIPILNYEDYEEDIYFYEVGLNEEGSLQHTGGAGVIACVMGQASDEMDCLDNCYNILEELIIPDKQYRTDLHNVLPEMIGQVVKLSGDQQDAASN